MKIPYWQLSGFYGLYFALLGCIVPFWGLYLRQQHFTAEDIGLLLALFSAVRIIAPNTWAATTHYFEKWFQSIHLIRLAGFLMLVCFVGVFWASEFWHFAVIMVLYGFFWSAVLPQYEALTISYTKDNMTVYSNIRLWGSIGFIIFVSLLGWFFDWISILFLPAFMIFLMLLIIINSAFIPEKNFYTAKKITNETGGRGEQEKDEVSKNGEKSLKLGIVSFLVINILLQICHGPYYVFFSIYLQELGYSSWVIGLLWSLGVLAEIIIFWKISFFIQRWSLKELVVLSLVFTSIRWLLTAFFSEYEYILIFSQCLHAFSFGLLHAVSVKYITQFFPGRQQIHGQALYSGLGFGLGGAIGAYVAGVAWDLYGALTIFTGAAVIALFAVLIALYGLPRGNNVS